MALPLQIQRDNKEIAAYEAAMIAEQAGTAVPAEQTEVIAAIPEPAEAVPEPEKELVSNVVELKPAEEESWKSRYLTLQGMQKADARSHKELKQQFERLQEQVAEMQTKPVVTPSLVTPDEEIEFGKDLIDVQRRIAREEITPVLAQVTKLTQENKELREQLGQTGAQIASSDFEHRLFAAVPDFDAVNADPKWVAWLDEIDPILRAPRRNVAQAAFERGDLEATVAYVDLFKALAKPAKTEPSTAAAELQSQVAPSKSSSNASASTAKQVATYTEAEAGKLFDKVGQLYRQGKTKEASELDTEITLAYHEGRVR